MTDDIQVTVDEEVPSWVTGDLDDVVEQKDLLPAAQNVLVSIKEVKINSEKEGEPRNWRWLSPVLVIEDGIEVDGQMKFKGKNLFDLMLCYYANYEFYKNRDSNQPDKYQYSKDIKTGQHMIDLKKFCKATGAKGVKIESINGISDAVAKSIADNAKGKKITVNVRQFTSKKTGITENAIGDFKAVSAEDLV